MQLCVFVTDPDKILHVFLYSVCLFRNFHVHRRQEASVIASDGAFMDYCTFVIVIMYKNYSENYKFK